MSRIAFFSIPAHGHTNPTLAVVRALTKRGHRVRYWSFEMFREKIQEAGAEFLPCDGFLPPAPPDLDNKVGKDFSALIEMVADTTLRMDEPVCRALEGFHPDCMVSDSLCFWGKLFAGKLGIPYICSTTTFAFDRETAPMMKPGVGETVRMLLGMPKVKKKLALLRRRGYPADSFVALIQNAPDTDTIVYTSRQFQPRGEHFPENYAFVGPSLAGTPRREERSRPLVYISLGTVMSRRPDFYRRCFAALGDCGLDVVLSAGETTDLRELGPVPGNFQVQNRVDQLAVLGSAAVFLTHCGMNSVHESIWSGVPMVLYPQQSEEALVARRAADLGTGLLLEKDTPEAIRAAVLRVLDDGSFARRTAELGESFRAAGGPNRAADFVESVILRSCEKIAGGEDHGI